MAERTTRKIRLQVESPKRPLLGIEGAIDALVRLEQRAIRTNTAIGSIGRGSLGNMSGLASQLSSTVGSITRSLDLVTLAAERARGAVAGVSNPSRPSSSGASGKGRFIFRGLSPAGFAKNVATVAAWGGAVRTVTGATDLIKYSFGRMEDLQLQTARLQQVFRGVGGSASELANDVLKLAAAEGRGTEAAMQSAVAWSRLGLTRKQAAEATRISLMAANVAEISAADATQALTSVMAGYNLQASDLAAVLGMLNQSSNTYRVTTAELLQGLSRVSNVARGAGMSLAELQGILTVSVQRTGQSGVNMANALKTVLSRINRDDVQSFFADRFGFQTTGSAGDLRKIWQVYSKSNEAQQRDITLKVGSATQANRFRAIMESYPQAINAATSALLNLSSAENENLLITNTLASARVRLISTWDRLVNSPGMNRAGSSFMNMWSGSIAGITNAIGSMAPGGGGRYFDPEKSSVLGIPLMAAANYSMLPGYVANKLGIGGPYNTLRSLAWRKMGFSSTPSSAQDVFAVESQNILNRAKAGEAYGMRSDWLKTVAGNWSGFTPGSRENVLAALGGVVSPEAIASLRGGDVSGITAAAGEYASKQQTEAQAAREATDASIRRLEAAREATSETQKLAEFESQIAERRGERAQIDQEVLSKMQEELLKAEALSRALSTQKGLVSDIAAAYHGLGLSPYAAEGVSLRSGRAVTRSLLAGETNEAAQGALKDRLREIESGLRYHNSPAARFLSSVASDNSIAAEMAGAEASSAGVGLSRGESLLSQRSFLALQLRGFDASKANAAEMVRAGVMLKNLKQVEIDLSKRALSIDQDRRQIWLETQREFQRSLVTAGPGQLLSKMAAAHFSARGVNSGQFFAMSGGMRSDIYNLAGGDRMASLNSEARALRGQTLGVTGLQVMASGADRMGQFIADRLGASLDASVSKLQLLAAASEAAALGLSKVAASGGSPTVAPIASKPAQATPAAPNVYLPNMQFRPGVFR